MQRFGTMTRGSAALALRGRLLGSRLPVRARASQLAKRRARKPARDAQRAMATAVMKRKVMRKRLDVRELPNGTVRAYLTVTLPGGNCIRVMAECDRATAMRVYRQLARDAAEVGFSLGGIWKGIKKVARGVATSKVFKAATKVLQTVGPALGPAAPAVMTAATAMKTSTMLLAAKQHAAKGTPEGKAAAKKLIAAAAQGARAKPVLDAAQHTSQRVYALLLKAA